MKFEPTTYIDRVMNDHGSKSADMNFEWMFRAEDGVAFHRTIAAGTFSFVRL